MGAEVVLRFSLHGSAAYSVHQAVGRLRRRKAIAEHIARVKVASGVETRRGLHAQYECFVAFFSVSAFAWCDLCLLLLVFVTSRHEPPHPSEGYHSGSTSSQRKGRTGVVFNFILCLYTLYTIRSHTELTMGPAALFEFPLFEFPLRSPRGLVRIFLRVGLGSVWALDTLTAALRALRSMSSLPPGRQCRSLVCWSSARAYSGPMELTVLSGAIIRKSLYLLHQALHCRVILCMSVYLLCIAEHPLRVLELCRRQALHCTFSLLGRAAFLLLFVFVVGSCVLVCFVV